MTNRVTISKLEKLITKHPLFDVIEFNINSGVDKSALLKFKNQYGFDVHPQIAKFYFQVNGFLLTYKLKDDSDDILDHFMQDARYTPGRDPIGSINFQSFEDVFLKDNWKGILYDTNSLSDTDELTFNGQSYTYNDLGKKIKPFDVYSEETCAAILLTEKNRFDVILLEDHYADWSNSRIIGFEDYFRLILLTGGLIQARRLYLSEIGGDEKAKFTVKNPKSIVPKFFKSMFIDFLGI
jgi:hypothetical protein